MRTSVSALLSGLLFGIGLAISGMTLPETVIAFLDIGGEWDPSLAFVMGGALCIYGLGYWRLTKPGLAPLFAAEFSIPTATGLDPRLLCGAAIFGIGWGVAGFCPGPALTAAASLSPSALYFVGAMLVGMWLQSRLDNKLQSPRRDETSGSTVQS